MLWGLLCRSLADVQSPQECHDLRSRAVVVGAEQVTADAAGNTIIHSPFHSFCVISVSRHIAEPGTARSGCLGGPEQESHALCAGTGGVRAERGAGRSGSDALLHRPSHCFGIV